MFLWFSNLIAVFQIILFGHRTMQKMDTLMVLKTISVMIPTIQIAFFSGLRSATALTAKIGILSTLFCLYYIIGASVSAASRVKRWALF